MAATIKVRIVGDAKGLQGAASDADAALAKVSSGLGKLAAIGASVGAGAFLVGAIGKASDLQETTSKIGVVFGDAGDDIKAFARSAAKDLGQTQQEALDAAATFGVFGKAAGLTGKELADFSTGLVELSTDLASFHNADPSEVVEALGAALRGEAEPMRRFGVLLDDATLRNEALRLGLVRTTKEALTPQQKTLAAHAAILKQTSDAQGDFARTSDGLANQTRILKARFSEAQTTIGEGLLPVVLELAGFVNDSLLPAFENVIPLVLHWTTGLINAGRAVGDMVEPLGPAITLVGEFAVGAGLTAIAAGKMHDGFVKVKTAIDTLKIAAASNPFTLLAAAAGALATFTFVELQKNAQEARERQESLTEAMRQGQDPTQQLADRMTALADEIKGVKEASGETEKTIEELGAAWAASEAQADGTLDTFVKYKISAQQMADITREGGDAFRETWKIAADYDMRLHDLDRALAGADTEQARFIRSLFDMAAAGKISRFELEDMLGTLANQAKAHDDVRQSQADAIRTSTEFQISVKNLTQEQVDAALAASDATDENQRWIDAGPAIEKALGGAADATDDLTTAQGEAAPAAAEVTDKVDAQKEALERAKRAMDDFQESVDEYVGERHTVAEAFDDVAKRINTLRERTDEAALGTEGFTTAAIDNRVALRDVVSEAGEMIKSMAEAGQTAEEQEAALGFFADQAYNTAIQAGFSADEAGRLRDNIIGIPTHKEITITTTYQTIGEQSLGPNGEVNIQGLAVGGRFDPGSVYRVGERGPELVRFSGPGQVVPAGQTAAFERSMGASAAPNVNAGTTINVSVSGVVGDYRDVARLIRDELRMLERGGI